MCENPLKLPTLLWGRSSCFPSTPTWWAGVWWRTEVISGLSSFPFCTLLPSPPLSSYSTLRHTGVCVHTWYPTQCALPSSSASFKRNSCRGVRTFWRDPADWQLSMEEKGIPEGGTLDTRAAKLWLVRNRGLGATHITPLQTLPSLWTGVILPLDFPCGWAGPVRTRCLFSCPGGSRVRLGHSTLHHRGIFPYFFGEDA